MKACIGHSDSYYNLKMSVDPAKPFGTAHSYEQNKFLQMKKKIRAQSLLLGNERRLIFSSKKITIS